MKDKWEKKYLFLVFLFHAKKPSWRSSPFSYLEKMLVRNVSLGTTLFFSVCDSEATNTLVEKQSKTTAQDMAAVAHVWEQEIPTDIPTEPALNCIALHCIGIYWCFGFFTKSEWQKIRVYFWWWWQLWATIAYFGNFWLFFFFWNCRFASCNFYFFLNICYVWQLACFHLANFSDITVSLLKIIGKLNHDRGMIILKREKRPLHILKNPKQSLSPPCSPPKTLYLTLTSPKSPWCRRRCATKMSVSCSTGELMLDSLYPFWRDQGSKCFTELHWIHHRVKLKHSQNANCWSAKK